MTTEPDVEPCYWCGSRHPVLRRTYEQGILFDRRVYEVRCDHDAPDAGSPDDRWMEIRAKKFKLGYICGCAFFMGNMYATGRTVEKAIRNYNNVQKDGRTYLDDYTASREESIGRRLRLCGKIHLNTDCV